MPILVEAARPESKAGIRSRTNCTRPGSHRTGPHFFSDHSEEILSGKPKKQVPNSKNQEPNSKNQNARISFEIRTLCCKNDSYFGIWFLEIGSWKLQFEVTDGSQAHRVGAE
jgi:hypothetical protein